MKIKWGALMVDGRGKIGGHVASKNRSGAYLRTKVTPVNPQTSFQANVRSLFTSLSQGWRTLTSAQRLAWNNAVALFSTTDIFGDLKNPTGKNLYQKLNTNLSTASIAHIPTPPLPVGAGTAAMPTATVTTAGQIISVAFDITPVPANTAFKIEVTPPLSASKSFVKNQFRILTVLAPAVASPYVATAPYALRFGAFVLGQRIWFKITPINTVTGEMGTPKISHADAG